VSGALKPCVKCGGSGNLEWSRDGEVAWVRCSKCGLESPLKYSGSEAAKWWNAGEERTVATTPSQGLDAATVEQAAISLIVDLCGAGASQSSTNVRVVEDHLRQFARALATDPHQHGGGHGQ